MKFISNFACVRKVSHSYFKLSSYLFSKPLLKMQMRHAENIVVFELMRCAHHTDAPYTRCGVMTKNENVNANRWV